MFRHLLVPTDGSLLAKDAVARAVQLAQAAGARITFFHVQDSPSIHPEVSLFGEGMVLDPLINDHFAQAHAAHAEQLLNQARLQAEVAAIPVLVIPARAPDAAPATVSAPESGIAVSP